MHFKVRNIMLSAPTRDRPQQHQNSAPNALVMKIIACCLGIATFQGNAWKAIKATSSIGNID